MNDKFAFPAASGKLWARGKCHQDKKETEERDGKNVITDVFQHSLQADINFGYRATVLIAVGCVMSKMGFAQVAVIVHLTNGMGMLMMPVVQIMNVQFDLLYAQQRQREERTPQYQRPFVCLAKKIHIRRSLYN
ncbi:MAG TPA: hypothetical protein ENK04_06795 [Gammaproteobacteria bacterium]|nr:hypothetical protein [Gammaproteobacteria bacterium]